MVIALEVASSLGSIDELQYASHGGKEVVNPGQNGRQSTFHEVVCLLLPELGNLHDRSWNVS